MGFNPEGGSRGFNFDTRPSQSDLHDYLRLVRGVKASTDEYFLRAESFFNVATQIEKLDEDFDTRESLTPTVAALCTSNHMGKLSCH